MKTILRSLKMHSFFYSMIMLFAAFICQLPTFIKSGFFSIYKYELFAVLSACILFCRLIWKTTHSTESVFITTTASMLIMGNFSQWYMNFASNSSFNITNFMLQNTAILVGIVISWTMLFFINKYRRKCKTISLCAICAAAALLLIVLIFGDLGNTSSVSIGGFVFQPAIIGVYIVLISFAIALSVNANGVIRFFTLLGFGATLGILFIKHETGIPLYCVAACFLVYGIMHKWSIRNLLLIITAVTLILGIVVMIKNPALQNDFSQKISIRTKDNYHTEAIANHLKTGWFGRIEYNYLPEASSDLSLANCVRYSGYIWLIFFLMNFCLSSILLWGNFSNIIGTSILNNLKKLSFTFLFVDICYNVADNVCKMPVIGVQSLFMGQSYSIMLLSGLILGTIIFDEKILSCIFEYIKKTNDKLTDVLNDDFCETE